MTNTILGIILLVLDIYAILQVLKSSAGAVNKLLWIVVILILPVIGLILWFFMGPKSDWPPQNHS